uniref:Uncharacterized protein n=1 Tax=Nelumbo nucifera TaxID=4432 RepID=A0A822XNK4_NELNU|nr:TPA_asm: hypothetical protein HUJ06_020561 [Nelumbo nucifera]
MGSFFISYEVWDHYLARILLKSSSLALNSPCPHHQTKG